MHSIKRLREWASQKLVGVAAFGNFIIIMMGIELPSKPNKFVPISAPWAAATAPIYVWLSILIEMICQPIGGRNCRVSGF